jgi:ABC-type Fe3+-hydroxamate transport system substrate-binding protein
MTRRSGRALGGLVAALVLVASACARPDRAPPANAAPRRLAVLAPAAAETLALLGAADRVVGVGDWVTWPPELAALPKLGSYDAPNTERLLELRVDALITTASVAGRGGREELERLGIRVIEIDTSTFAGTLAGIDEIGKLVGREERARELVRSIRSRLDAVAARVAGAPRRSVLVVVGREPLFVAGPGSHLDELVRLAGGANVAADAGSAWALVSLESVLARRPEVIVDSSDNRPGALRGAVAGEWARWPFLPAVEAGRVYHLDPSRLSIPGPRLPEMAELVGRLIHPEIFGAPRPGDFGPLAAPAASNGGGG